jgi:uncharacterized metal-binding protein/predicted Fe-Mo cluster-binding NifX family protein
MRYGIAVAGGRVAPRCVFAEMVLVVVQRGNSVRTEETLVLANQGLLQVAQVMTQSRIDVLICGGISQEERDFLASRRVQIIDNVAGSIEELLEAARTGTLRSGFGLAPPLNGNSSRRESLAAAPVVPNRRGLEGNALDCLACRDRKCLRGEPCGMTAAALSSREVDAETMRMFEAALDVSCEEERTLCRLSELIYFCIEMRYRRIGVAYCVDLEEPAEILTRVLRRFFEVYPVCCKIGAMVVTDPLAGPQAERGQKPFRVVACNPKGQVEALNRIGVDLNVMVGMSMGADCIFSRFSDAPVTALFVKDKSLANNPIGAIYSDYYLREAIQTAPRDLSGQSQQ